MKLINIFNPNKNRQPETRANLAYTKNTPITKRLKYVQPYRVDVEMNRFKQSVELAMANEDPRRTQLIYMYKKIVQDAHLASQMRTAILKVLEEPFEASHELFNGEWFQNFMQYAIEAEFWGHSLIEFDFSNDDPVAILIPRENVIPNTQQVITDLEYEDPISYADLLNTLNLIEIGGRYDLGLLEPLAKEVIWKNYSRSDWSQSSEKYAMPRLVIRTESTDTKDLDRKEEMAANFGANGYAILNKDDEITIQQPDKTDFYKIYLEKVNLCDAQISKLINGQTATSDEKAYVGSAEVQERLLDSYTKARLKRAQSIVNKKLIPLLAKNGKVPAGTTFSYPVLEQNTEKKKLSNTLSLPDWVIDTPETGCCQ